MDDQPLALVLFSGTDDKLNAAAVLTAGAAALGRPVHVFLQYWALDAFRADRIDADHGLAPEAGAEGRAAVDALRAAGQAPWYETLAPGQGPRRGRHPGLLALDGPARHRAGRPRPARRRRRGRDRLLPRTPATARSSSSRRPDRPSRSTDMTSDADPLHRRRQGPLLPDAHRQDGPGTIKTMPAGAARRGPGDRPRLGQGLRAPGPDRPATRSSSRPRTAASTASSSARPERSEGHRHDHRRSPTSPTAQLTAAEAAAADRRRGGPPGPAPARDHQLERLRTTRSCPR